MIERLRALWPTRPIKLRSPVAAWRGWVFALFCVLFAGGILAYVGISLAPGLIDDVQMRNRARPVQMARIEGGRCSSRLALLHSCEATVVATTKEGLVRRPLNHVFFDLHVGGWTAQVLADPERAGVFSTDIGLDRIWHRFGTALFFIVIALVMLVSPWSHLRRAAAERRRIATLSEQPVTPVALAIQGWQGQVVTLADPSGASHRWTMPNKTPLFALGGGYVLGVTGASGEAFPLDEKLRWARLTDLERAALKQARPA
ncbi:hypothetical protein [Plastoroseomonas arctica]|uniref:Uncharacterized protein n=1 Tax=Plastoroseomonas arctica TaxID=1509237 RepID=A0AAF1KNW6_9PROT|nr:hypothetical protein [Plastoroseomonas arctica]MBR0656729.1 hypothetical protein [Plastoroseomonas arctica]